MNIYYLKKFRKKAQRQYCACWDEDLRGEDIWRIRVKKSNRQPFYVGPIYYSKEDVLDALKESRRRDILFKVRRIKHNRIYKKKSREYNKQLAKL